jgi:hypothetical protein
MSITEFFGEYSANQFVVQKTRKNPRPEKTLEKELSIR